MHEELQQEDSQVVTHIRSRRDLQQQKADDRPTMSSGGEGHTSMSLNTFAQLDDNAPGNATPRIGSAPEQRTAPPAPSPQHSSDPETFVVTETPAGHLQATSVAAGDSAPFPEAAQATAGDAQSHVSSPRSGGGSPGKTGERDAHDEVFADRMMAVAAFGTQAAAGEEGCTKPRGRSSERGRKGLRSVSRNAHAVESMAGDSDTETFSQFQQHSSHKQVHHRHAHE